MSSSEREGQRDKRWVRKGGRWLTGKLKLVLFTGRWRERVEEG